MLLISSSKKKEASSTPYSISFDTHSLFGFEVHMKRVIYFVPFHLKRVTRLRSLKWYETCTKNHVESNSKKISSIESAFLSFFLYPCVCVYFAVDLSATGYSITYTAKSTTIHSILPFQICSMYGAYVVLWVL